MDNVNKNEDLNFDSISFEDMVGEGITDSLEPQIEELAEQSVVEQPAAPELDADAVKKETVDSSNSEEVPATENISEETVEEVQEEIQEKVQEEAVIEDEEVEQTVVSEVLTELGFEPHEEYDDTPEGLTKMTQDVAAKLAEEQLEEILGNYPLIKQHMEYVIAGGDSRNFMSAHDPQQDYSMVQVQEDDQAMQRVLVGNYFKSKGHDDNFIKEMLNDYTEGGKLFEKAQTAKTALSQLQTQQRVQMMEHQKHQRTEQAKDQQKFWANITDVIQNGDDFAGIHIAAKNKNKFLKYLSQPVNKQGHTQSMIDHQNAPLDQRLAMDYLMFNKFNLKDIINTKVKTTKAKDLKSRLKAQQSKVKNVSKAKRTKTSFDIDDLDLSFGV